MKADQKPRKCRTVFLAPELLDKDFVSPGDNLLDAPLGGQNDQEYVGRAKYHPDSCMVSAITRFRVMCRKLYKFRKVQKRGGMFPFSSILFAEFCAHNPLQPPPRAG